MSVLSICGTIIETITNLKRIREMANYSCPVKVMRHGKNGELTEMESIYLVPGDVIEVPE